MIKITSVAKDGMKAKSVVAIVQALAAGERDPRAGGLGEGAAAR
ncbi:MAG TPA: hypothetical protein VGD83_36820 [Streptosporangiaceae bacterium]